MKEGKRLRITKLRETPVLEITVPPDMRLTMTDPEDLPPEAILEGRDGVIEIFNPESPWGGLDNYLRVKSGGEAEILLTQRLFRGFLVIDRTKSKWAPDGYHYGTIVSRPDLGVDCIDRHPPVTTPAKIEKIASICLSLREAVSKD